VTARKFAPDATDPNMFVIKRDLNTNERKPASPDTAPHVEKAALAAVG
jgi:hypothetical protein